MTVLPSVSIAAVLSVGAAIFAIHFLISSAQAVYGAFFGPLSKFPGPKAWACSPLFKLWGLLKGNHHMTIQRLHAAYGPVVRIAPNEISFLGTPAVWNDVHGFSKAGEAKPHKDPKMYRAEINGSRSLLAANDQDHSRMRKALSHAFSDRALKEQEPILKHWVSKLVKSLCSKAANHESVDMLKSYNCTTFDIMGDLTFSENLHMLDKGELSPWVETIFATVKTATVLGVFAMAHPILKYLIMDVFFTSEFVRKKAWEHWNYTRERLDRRLSRESVDQPDFWSKILAKGSDAEGGLSLGEHHANASLFMMAGTETTATALTGTTFHLLRNPVYLQKLQHEIRSAFPSFEDITLTKIAQLKYLHACLSEGLRMYPPVPITMVRRTPAVGCRIGEWFVPGDVIVGINTHGTHRSPTNFKHPDEFHPERWLGGKGFESDNINSMEVFSHGPRNCLGKNLAWHEMRLILASVIFHYDLELNAQMETWDQQKVFSLWEKVPLMCTLSSAEKA